MTLWNPLNVFSGRTHSAADGPSASFDPSRTGDPLGPRPADPAIGLGGTQIGSPVEHGDPRRHPIGFAPPADAGSPSRASARRSPSSATTSCRARRTTRCSPRTTRCSWQPPWQSRPRQRAGRLGRSSMQVDVVEVPPVAEESVPFFKREISFRRKKTDGARQVAAEATSRRSSARSLSTRPRRRATDEVTDCDRRVGAPGGRGRRVRRRARGHEDQSSRHDEIVAADEPEPIVAEAVTSEDDADAAVPFYKRELSFRRKKTAEVAQPPRSCRGRATRTA